MALHRLRQLDLPSWAIIATNSLTYPSPNCGHTKYQEASTNGIAARYFYEPTTKIGYYELWPSANIAELGACMLGEDIEPHKHYFPDYGNYCVKTLPF